MPLPKNYSPDEAEPRLQSNWEELGIYHFDRESSAEIYSVDTPPATVSGKLHLGHCYSYSHADFVVRFWRMNGKNIFYPMGYDDNGLPTERLVEKRMGITALKVGRQAFIEKCMQVSEEAEKEYETLWKRMGLSIDWRYSYRTIDESSRRISQYSFIDLYEKGLAYRQKAPTIWCPECRTAIAQAEISDLERQSEFVTLAFGLPDGNSLKIATTRPELLPACVAIFVHPDDKRYQPLLGKTAKVPLFGQDVPILADPNADPEKGTGAVMCCTFGDTTDVAWWRTHKLPLIEAIGRDGNMTEVAGEFSGLSTGEARQRIKKSLEEKGLLSERQSTTQTVRVHERCDTPVEFVVTDQWFIHVLEYKEKMLDAGANISWHPEHMGSRYKSWIENLNWDWCISRQRYFGVPFPVWYCADCGEITVADINALPVDPLVSSPGKPCKCGSTNFKPEQDVMDTWATSSVSPQIAGRWLADPDLYKKVFPMSLRPQAHEIIRTWTFYTVLKSHHHFGVLPWSNILISGWGLAGEGMGKISKSRGGGPMAPIEMIGRYSADAIRYWAANAGPGKDAIISEEKIQNGDKLVTKLWNVARFTERFLEGYTPTLDPTSLTPADQWILSLAQKLIRQVTNAFLEYDYASAKSETESFFWNVTDNYMEMAKQRLYSDTNPKHAGAQYTMYQVLLTVVKLFAPLLPHITDEIYLGLFAHLDGAASVHRAQWPTVNNSLVDDDAEAAGNILVEIASAARRYKSEHNLSLGFKLKRLQLATSDPALSAVLQSAVSDLESITRAEVISITGAIDPGLEIIKQNEKLIAAIEV
ncbi:MAG: valine--tRNA ligase [Anaerolineales bacterium]